MPLNEVDHFFNRLFLQADNLISFYVFLLNFQQNFVKNQNFHYTNCKVNQIVENSVENVKKYFKKVDFSVNFYSESYFFMIWFIFFLKNFDFVYFLLVFFV